MFEQQLSSVCQELSERNFEVAGLKQEKKFLISLLKDAYLEANSEFTEETKTTIEKVIGPIKW